MAVAVPKLSYRDYYAKYAQGSTCATTIIGPRLNPDGVRILFSGPVANIPALKNEKIKGTNILRPEARARLVLAGDMVRKSLENNGIEMPEYGPKVKLFCLVLCAYRGRPFDEDNVGTTIKDWLEPRIIRHKDRKWGLGIVPNDKEVNIFTVKLEKKSTLSHLTQIYLLPLEKLANARREFIWGIGAFFPKLSIDEL